MAQLIGYIRVSTKMQGASGLGLEGQAAAIAAYADRTGGDLIAVYRDIESGRKSNRPGLHDAMAHANRIKGRLVVAKLDRLGRRASDLLAIRDSRFDVVALDSPNADNFLFGVLAVLAEKEADDISARTRAALQAAKARGVRLGGPKAREAAQVSAAVQRQSANEFAARVRPVIESLESSGVTTLSGIADRLNEWGIPTARGGRWYPQTVRNIRNRAPDA